MVRIDYLVFGYRKLWICPEKLSEATSILIRASISSTINSDGTLTVRERDFSKTKDLFKGRIDFEYSEPLGLYGKYKLLPHKLAYLTSAVFSIIFIFLFSSLVWDVKIDGNENIPDSEIAVALRECGLSVGDFWPTIDRGNIETKLLRIDERISWVNVNKRGSVAYITIMEKENKDETREEIFQYSNLVASVDCVIEEITVKRGTAVVKPGDAVKRGDILIIGALPQESGGGFCSADGSVVGRVNEKITVEVDRKYEKITGKDKKIYSISLNFFKFSLNIFKLYGNLTNKCDIIETEKTYSLFGKCRLPFSISIKYMPEYQITESEYTDDELVIVASSRLDALCAAKLYSSDLLKIKSYGEFTDGGYKMRSDIIYLSEVSERLGFEA